MSGLHRIMNEPGQGDPVLIVDIFDGYTEFKALIFGECYIDHFPFEGDQVSSEGNGYIKYLSGINREIAFQSLSS